MLTTHKYKSLAWVDAESPNNKEVKKIMQEYGIHPIVGEELLSPTLKPRLDVYDNYIYLILHFPAIRHTHSNEKNQEIDFIISKNFLITTRYDTVDALHKFSSEFETSSIIDKSTVTKHAGFIFYFMIKKLYKSIGHELEYIESSLKKIEEKVFKGKERQMVKALSDVNRNLIDMKQTIQHHGEILRELQEVGKKYFSAGFVGRLREIYDDYRRVMHTIEDHQEFLHELRETNDSLLSTKQNEVMKVLTIMAFITFPLSLVASIFGMNTTYLPIVGLKGDFWMVVGIMIVLMFVMFIFFKHKKWL